MTVSIPVSFGEFFDRLSILELKADRIQSDAKRARAQAQLAGLLALPDAPSEQPVTEEVTALRRINARLWDAENEIRACADPVRFAAMAQDIQTWNRDRAQIKARIDDRLGCVICEVKDYGVPGD